MIMQKVQEIQTAVFEQYAKKTPKSRQVFEAACKVLAGGVQTSTRFVSPYPLQTSHGKGSKIYDVDGNEYVDCCLQFGPLLLGHCHPEVMEKIRKELERGLILVNTDLAVECAQLIKEIVPCAEKVRFANSGTEADMFAVRAARAFTGKNKIIRFYGHYHGQDDQFMVGISRPSDEIVCAGVPKESVANSVCLYFHDLEAIKKKLDSDNDIAGIILDPGMYQGGIWPPTREFMEELRRITEQRGVMLIFDEIITGFRVALGGAQEYFGVKPDVAALSKAIASGAKLAAVAGREEVMATLAPRGLGLSTSPAEKKLTLMSGTYAEGTIGLAAAIATLKILKRLNKQGQYQRLFGLSETLKNGIEKAFKQRGIPCTINMFGPYMSLFLTDQPPAYETYIKLDSTLLRLFTMALIAEGILPTPRVGQFLLSFVHTEEDINRVLNAVNKVLDQYRFREAL